MINSESARKLAENQVHFREPNEKISEGFSDLKAIAEEEDQTGMLPEFDASILFYCECSDEKCKKRIKLKLSKYEELHQNRCQFILLPGHNVPEIERIVQSEDDYIVVEKYFTPPKAKGKPNPTNLNHQ